MKPIKEVSPLMSINNSNPSQSCQSNSQYPQASTHRNITTTTSDDLRSAEAEVVSPRGATPISCPPQVVNFGFDTVHINFWVDWSRSKRFDLFQALKEAKVAIQSGLEKEMPFHMGRSEIFAFNLQRTGTRFQKYHLRTGDVSMYLDPRDYHSAQPNMVLQIGSLTSQQDVVVFVAQYINWINYVGGVVVKQDVTRADICADLKASISDTNIFCMDRWITRANKHSFDGSNRENSGVTIGKGDILLRVYDKQKEMKEKKAFEKMCFFNDKWGTNFTDSVTRFEFQVRGKSLKEMFSNSTERPLFLIEMNLAYIWSYLTKEWFRLSENPVDRENKNQAHSKIAAIWECVQQSSGFQAPPITRNRKQRHINIPALKKQIAGCVLTVCAGVGHAVDDFFGMMATCTEVVHETVSSLFDDPTFKTRFLSKQLTATVSF
jgi:hypothetical protein